MATLIDITRSLRRRGSIGHAGAGRREPRRYAGSRHPSPIHAVECRVPDIVPLKVQAIAWTHFEPPADVPWETDADGGQALAEFAGRACYQSWTKPNPATATNAGYLRHILEVGHLSVLEHGIGDVLPDRHLPVADPRADPAPALQLLAAVAALRARARRRDGRAGRHRRGPRAARQVRRGDRGGGRTPTPSCSRGWRRSSPTSSTRRCAASRPARPRARCCPTPPRPASSSPATTGPGGTSSRCARPSTPTSRSARWPSPACASCSASPPNAFADFEITALPDGTEVASSPLVSEG